MFIRLFDSFYESCKINAKRNPSFLSGFFQFDNICLKNILIHFPDIINAINIFSVCVHIHNICCEKFYVVFSSIQSKEILYFMDRQGFINVVY